MSYPLLPPPIASTYGNPAVGGGNSLAPYKKDPTKTQKESIQVMVAEPRLIDAPTLTIKTGGFPWLATTLGVAGLTAIGLGGWKVANKNKLPKIGDNAATGIEKKGIQALNSMATLSSKTPAMLEAMYQVFANTTDFLPYQINVLKTSTATKPPAKKSLINTLTASISSRFFKKTEPIFNEANHAIGYLQAVEKLKNADNIYLGDLHGAWQKGLQHLAMAELIQMPEATAKEFVRIHAKLASLYKVDGQGNSIRFSDSGLASVNKLVQEFKQALSQVQVVDDGRGIHLVGDIVGDRGQNDILTLLLLDHCKEKIKSRVFSNHDFAAIEKYQLEVHHQGAGAHIGKKQSLSAERAFELANANLPNKAVDKAQLKALYEAHFKQLELIHYDEQTETLSLHQAFKPEKLPQLLALYISDANERNRVLNQLNHGDKQAYKEAIRTINRHFKACVSEKWLKGDAKNIEEQLVGFYEGIWYGSKGGDSRRDFAMQALPEDKGFPFYNQKAVKNIAFGHHFGKNPVVKGTGLVGEPMFYLLDQGACKPDFSYEEQFSRLFIPTLANTPQPLSTVA